MESRVHEAVNITTTEGNAVKSAMSDDNNNYLGIQRIGFLTGRLSVSAHVLVTCPRNARKSMSNLTEVSAANSARIVRIFQQTLIRIFRPVSSGSRVF